MSDHTMRRISVTEFGGPERLGIATMEAPTSPGSGQVLVDVEAAGINYLDVLQRKGLHGATVPLLPGLEGVGRVRDAAPDCGLSPGQRVAWVNVPSSYSTQVLMPASLAVPVPDSFTVAQCMLFQALTAQYLATEYRHVRPGDHVLVHAAAGGVGQLLVCWMKHLGAWVIGTASSNEKLQAIRAAGADAAIDYGRDYSFADQVMAATDGQGVDLAFDAIGAGSFASTLKVLAQGGTAVCYGLASGPAQPISPQDLIPRNIRVAGGNLFGYITDPAQFQARSRVVVAAIKAGWLAMPPVTEFRLEQAAEAHRALEGRATTGKLVLVP